MGDPNIQKPNVFLHTEFTGLLSATKSLGEKSDTKGGTSFQAWGIFLRVDSRTKVKRMFKGSIPMPKNVLDRLGERLELSAEEVSYLNLLRNFEQINDPEIAVGHYEAILAYRKRHLKLSESHPLEATQLKLLKNWFTMPVLYSFDLLGARPDELSIAQAFK
jgi:hypothetical protein